MDDDVVTSFYEKYWRDPSKASGLPDGDARRRLQLVESVLRGRRGGRLLDVGCGSGEAMERLSAAGFEVCGLEVSSTAIQAAAVRHPGLAIVRHAVEDEPWPFPDASFDGCVSFEVLEHLLDPRPLFRQAARVLRPGGILLVSTPYHHWVKNVLLVTFAFEHHFCNLRSGHVRFYSDVHISRIAEDHGFKVQAAKHYGRVWPVWSGILLVASLPADPNGTRSVV